MPLCTHEVVSDRIRINGYPPDDDADDLSQSERINPFPTFTPWDYANINNGPTVSQGVPATPRFKSFFDSLRSYV